MRRYLATNRGHLGDVTKAIRETFDRARAHAPCVLFIDELDSIQGRGRSLRSDDWWTAIVNTLLEQLDGLVDREGVVVIGATNYPETIDPAILRAGRLDRVVWILLPDAAALRRILRIHLGQDVAGVDLGPVADRLEAQQQTGADVEKIVRAGRRAARQAGRPMSVSDLLAQVDDVRISSAAVWRVAVHEAGHAVAACVLAPENPVHVSIRGAGGIGGWMAQRRHLDVITRSTLGQRLTVLLAGRAAEEMILGEASAGAGGDPSSDLAQATGLAIRAVAQWGLAQSRRTLRWHEVSEADLPPDLDVEVDQMLTDAYATATDLLHAHCAVLHCVAERLREAGELSGSEITTLLHHHGEKPPEPRSR